MVGMTINILCKKLRLNILINRLRYGSRTQRLIYVRVSYKASQLIESMFWNKK